MKPLDQFQFPDEKKIAELEANSFTDANDFGFRDPRLQGRMS
jgi:hypothetical protein